MFFYIIKVTNSNFVGCDALSYLHPSGELEGRQLGWWRIPDLRQTGARYVLSSTIPRYSYSSQLTDSCTILDPLGAQALRRPGQLLGRGDEDVPVSLLAIFSNFTCFLLCCVILILFYPQEHFCLAEDISLEVANIVFTKVAWKVIKTPSNMPALYLLPHTTLRYCSIHCI
jgi:hypothetical protein